MTFILRYWKEAGLALLVAALAFSYYLNIQNAKEVGKLETEIELQEQQRDKIERSRDEISAPSTPADNDASSVLQQWESRRSD